MKRLFLLLVSLGFTAFAAPNPPTVEDPKIAISPVVRSMEQLGGTGAINTSGSGTWKASVSSSWIHLTATSGTAGYAVGYTVDANNEVEQRIGYVYVSGYVHTITQDGIGATLDQSSADFEWGGGSGSVSVSAPSGKTWHAKSNVSWISVSSSSGTGATSVKYTVAKFDEVSTRSGTLTIADRTFTVNQTGRRMTLKEYSSSSDYLADTVKIKVNALASTEWSVSKNVDWIAITDAGNGHGGDTVEISIAENPSYNARSGKVTIGTETFTVSQQGRDSLVFRIGRTEAEYDENGISLERVAVTATPDLGWAAKSGVDWIEVSSSAKSGSGDGSFTYKVKPNPTLYPRSGEITVTAASATVPVKRLEISQKAAVATLSMSSYTFESAKESVQLGLATGAIVGWEVINTNSWLTVAGATKVGSCTLTLTAAQNTSVRSRSGVVRIADHDFVVTQRGRGVKLSYEERVFNTDGKTTGANAENVITVTTDSDVSWAAIASDPTWIVIYQGMSGTGNGTIKFVVAPYVGAGEIRKGTITVGDQTVYVTQRPYELSIDPKGEWVDSNAGAGEIQVAMDINKVWEAISTEPWLIIIQKYDSGTGNGKVLFQFTENTTGRQRTGKIMIAGETYTLTQEARQTATIDAVVESRGGTVSGGGIYDIGAELTLTAVADDGYEFDCWLRPGGGTSKDPLLKTTVASAGTYTARFVPAKLNLKVELACLKGVRLGWANLAWTTQYRIWRGTSSVRSQAAQIGTVTADGTCTYMDESGVTGQLYWYWVEAVGAEEQTWSEAFAGTRARGTFAITYENLRGTTHANPSQYTEGSAVSLKAPSVRVGYTFVGWEPSAITADTTGDVTVYAVWEQNTYAVQFNANGGRGEMSAENFTYGFWKYLTAGEFTRPAYTFTGWALKADGAQTYDDTESVKNLTATQSGTVPLYAMWTRTAGMGLISYENLKDATHANPECYDEGDAFTFTAPTAVTGYTFANWIPAGITAETRGDITVQANWTANKYQIVYDGNGGDGTTAATDCEYGTAYEAAGSGFSRIGYSFTGWSTNANGEVVYLPGAAVSNLTAVSGGSVKFYAVWETNRYQVVFNANGGSGTMAPQEFLYFEQQALNANCFAKTGYGFAGWATNAAKSVVFADKAVVSNLTTVADGEVDLYAKWTVNAYTVKFNPNGGTGTMANESMTYDAEKALTTCAFTRKGYTFAGWATSAGGAVKYADGASVKNLAASGTTTLYAKWTPNSYVVDFNPGQGGEGSMSDQPMTYDEDEALYLNLFQRTGYTFLGWTDDENELKEVLYYDGVVVSNLTDEVDGEYDLYAVWTANAYTVKFNANGGTGMMADQAFLYDEEQSLRANAFARTGYSFAGWAVGEGADSTVLGDGEVVGNMTTEADGVVTLYAVWQGNPYTVRFDANGGEGTMGDLNCMYGTAKALTACAFTRTCYTFAGWAKSAGGAVMYADRASVTDVAASGTVTLYAKWNPIAYSVKFNANGGKGAMANQTFLYEEEQGLRANAFTRTGYAFAGWATSEDGAVVYTDGQSVKNLTEDADGGVNLYAVWKVNAYKLTAKPKSTKYGLVSGSGTYDYGTKVQLKATAKDGYVFTGWFTDADCTQKLNPVGYDNRKPTIKYAMPGKATTVYAKFNSVTTDKSGLKFSDSTKKLAKTAKSYAANAKVSLALGFSSKSYPKVTATGLPSGLSIDALTGKITGTVKKPGAYTVKVTVTSAAGNKITQNVKIDVKAPSWAYGTFSGYGAVVVKGKTVPVSATFTATAVGKVSGKVIYKGRTASFTANYASATDTESRFTVSFSADGVAFKSAMSIKQKTSGLTYTRAHALKADSFELELQKVVPLVEKGKSLEGMIGKSYTFKYGYANAGLTKSGDKLVVKFADKDVVKLSGIAGGKSFSGLSASVMACGKSKTEPTTKYKLNVPVVEPTTKYYRLLTFKVTIETATKKVTKIEKAFGEIE